MEAPDLFYARLGSDGLPTRKEAAAALRDVLSRPCDKYQVNIRRLNFLMQAPVGAFICETVKLLLAEVTAKEQQQFERTV